MFFEYPRLLWLLAVPALLVAHYVYLEWSGRRPNETILSDSGLKFNR